MRKTTVSMLIIVAGCSAMASAAAAQPPDDDPERLGQSLDLPLTRTLYDSWILRFEPVVWFVAPGGELNLPGEPPGADFTLLGDLNLDSPRASPFGELHFRTSDIWRFSLSGFAIESDDRGSIAERPGFVGPHAYAAGDQIVSSIRLASGQMTAGWRLPLELGKRYADFEGRIELIGGARFLKIDLDVEAPSGGVSIDEFFVEPLFGAKLNMEITRRFTIDVQNLFGYFNTGGDHSIYTWDILAGFMWFPQENVGLQIGYRQLLYQLQSGATDERFELNGAAAGVYAGVTIRY